MRMEGLLTRELFSKVHRYVTERGWRENVEVRRELHSARVQKL
jgi:hypothetical protein